MALRVVLAEDNALVRDGMARLIESQPDLELTGLAADLPGLVDLIDRERPDVVVTDIRMPPTSRDEGIRAANHVRKTNPATGHRKEQRHHRGRTGPVGAGGGETRQRDLRQARVERAAASATRPPEVSWR